MSFNEKIDLTLDDFLMIIHNPLRRKILSKIVQGKKYTLELARELGTTQQAIMKHLKILEKYGIVKCVEEESPEGPKRKCYFPTKSFGVWISLQPHIFDEAYFIPTRDEKLVMEKHRKHLDRLREIEKLPGEKAIEALRAFIHEIQDELRNLQNEEKSLVYLLNMAMELGKTKIMDVEQMETRRWILISLYSTIEGDEEDD